MGKHRLRIKRRCRNWPLEASLHSVVCCMVWSFPKFEFMDQMNRFFQKLHMWHFWLEWDFYIFWIIVQKYVFWQKSKKKKIRRKRFGNVWNFVCLFEQLHLLAFWRIIILGIIALHKKKNKRIGANLRFVFFFVIISELCKMDSCCFSNKWFKYRW